MENFDFENNAFELQNALNLIEVFITFLSEENPGLHTLHEKTDKAKVALYDNFSSLIGRYESTLLAAAEKVQKVMNSLEEVAEI